MELICSFLVLAVIWGFMCICQISGCSGFAKCICSICISYS